jgi:hypothetical protein
MGKMLPLSNAIYYPSDLVKLDSGRNVDDEDYILFYAEGLDTWNEEIQLTAVSTMSNPITM